MNRDVVAATTAATAIYIACAISIFFDPSHQADPVVTRLATAAIIALAISFTYFLGKMYCLQWAHLGGAPMLLWLVEKIAVPVISALMVPGVRRAFESARLTMVFIVLILVLADLPRAFHKALATWFPEPRYGDRVFFLQFPPKRRMDMLPMDFAMIGVIGYIFFRNFDWH